MYGSASNRPLLNFRWLTYAAVLALLLASSQLFQTTPSSQGIWPGLWVAGACGVFLLLHTITPLSESSRLTFPRLGLSLGETMIAVLAIAVLGGNDPVVQAIGLLVALLISLEHGPKLGAMSAVIISGFGFWSYGLSQGSLLFALLSAGVVALPLVLAQAEAVRRELHLDKDQDQLDRAYQIARRETSKRQVHEQELYQERRRFEGLVDIALGLASFREQDHLLQRVVEVAADQLHARSALVLLQKGDRLTAQAESGMPTLMMEAFEKAVDLEMLQALSQHAVPLTFARTEAGRGTLPHPELLKKLSSVLGLDGERQRLELRVDQMVATPLCSAQDSRPLGLLVVVNHSLDRSFTEAEAKYLQVLAANTAIALKNIFFTAELERSHWELIQALAQAIEAKDSYTSNHVGRVRDISVEIARAIGLEREAIKRIAISATLHDVGKISTPDRVLLKPGPLTDEEYDIMKQHAANGALILRGIRSLPEGVEAMVRHHHERWDGKGYPDGLQGKAIPLGAQIISIADCYDAMTYDRPYRKGFTPQEALKRMEMGCGSQFNPKLLCAFFAIQGYVPQTEPSAVATYAEIAGRLHLGSLKMEGKSPGNFNSSSGGLGQSQEKSIKPLLLERN